MQLSACHAASVREPVLFSGTIRDNIAGWRDVTDEEVQAAAAAANAAVFINRARDRYATKAHFLAERVVIWCADSATTHIIR